MLGELRRLAGKYLHPDVIPIAAAIHRFERRNGLFRGEDRLDDLAILLRGAGELASFDCSRAYSTRLAAFYLNTHYDDPPELSTAPLSEAARLRAPVASFDALRNPILEQFSQFAPETAPVGKQKLFVALGGGGGTGKSSFLSQLVDMGLLPGLESRHG